MKSLSLAQELHNDSSTVRVVEVGPRDGLQNTPIILSVEERVALILQLADAGQRDIEVGSFVHPRWIPQMANTDKVFVQLPQLPDVRYWALVPNMRGLERAVSVGVRHIAVFISSSETHNRHNLNRTIDQSLNALQAVMKAAKAEGVVLRGYISTIFGCPFEGDVDFNRVLRIGESLLEAGADELSFGDTTGEGSPHEIEPKMRQAIEAFGVDRVALHLHDTRGLALVNATLALRAGVRIFDSSIGGMGGCPYAPGASGNIATEDLVLLFNSLGLEHGISLEKLVEISSGLQSKHRLPLSSKYLPYALSKRSSPTSPTRANDISSPFPKRR